jgi:hypothetical protein
MVAAGSRCLGASGKRNCRPSRRLIVSHPLVRDLAEAGLGDMLLDSHSDATVRTPFDNLHGWAPLLRSCERIEARCRGCDIPFARPPRPDVAALGPDPFLTFSLYLDLPSLSHNVPISPGPLEIEFFGDGAKIATCTVQIAESAIADNEAILVHRKEKREFILRSARRPLHSIPRCRALSGLPMSWPLSPDTAQKTDAVSAQAYREIVVDLLNELGSDKYVLDAGAGLRAVPAHNVVNMDIYDYPSTDILAIGQDLPFRDNVFDAVLSLAVLEHVDDPFLCARELIRVVKPGGKLLVNMPHVWSEHGYPSHYFNATRFGVQKLFSEGAALDKQVIEWSNHPIITINHLLGVYAAGLPDAVRRRFLKTSIEELIGGGISTAAEMHAAQHEFVTGLRDEAQWALAAATTSIFVKDV